MNISSNYDYKYNTGTSAAHGHHKTHHGKKAQDSDMAQQLLNLTDDSSQNSKVDKPKGPLDSLVESGTITSDQEKAIKDAFETSRMAFNSQPDGINGANTTNTFKSPLDSLVEAGTITKEQGTAVKSAFEATKGSHRMHHMPFSQDKGDGKPDPISSDLDSLVADGTINSDQKNKILSTLQNAFKPFEAKSEPTADPLDSLVNDGTITKDQLNAIKSVFESDRKAHGGLADNTAVDNDSASLTSAQKSAFDSALKAYEAQSYSYDDTFFNSFNKGT
ncbi:MAG: hypothetical protein Q8942_16705 [Bacillota bacterium]|nr:hypothetical protein [Bacillota bacterium]